MIRLVRSELIKLRTTPGPWLVLGLTLLFTALGIVGAFLVGHSGRLHGHVQFIAPHTVHRLRLLVGAGFSVGGVWMAAIIGVLCVTGEYRHKVVTTTFLVEPRRWRVIVAKSIASVLCGLLLGVASLVLVAAMGVPLLAAEGGSVSALLHQVGPVVPGLLGAFAILGLFGVGFGALVQNQVAGVLIVLAITFIVEPIFDGLLPSVGRWLPSAAASAVAGQLGSEQLVPNLLVWWLGVIVLIAWGLVPTVLGYFTTTSRDVT